MNNSSSADAAFSETIIIIGAGAAGLMAAKELSAAGKDIIVLEAGKEPGGRIRTLPGLPGDGFSLPVEAGAEFVHGQLPLTLQLLKSAGIPYHPVKGKMINIRKGKWLGQGEVPAGWGKLMNEMQKLGADMPLSVFLSTRFHGEKNAPLRDSVRRFAQGFDLADIHRASTKALYKEWSQEEGAQYRIEGGYGRLIDWLAGECRRCCIHLSSAVEKIDWEPGYVRLTTADGKHFTGSKAIVAVPLGILQNSLEPLNEGIAGRLTGAIRFSPAIDDWVQAAGQMGYGTVIKILLRFSTCFWNKKDKKIGFLLSDEAIPTWWTQFPGDTPLLTAWIPGDAMHRLKGMKEADLPELCLSSLASIFAMNAAEIRDLLVAVKVVDWSAEPFIRGGYSFETVESAAARQVLNRPVQDTLYFAGEALYDGEAPATVEAALVSGKKTAEKIIEWQRK